MKDHYKIGGMNMKARSTFLPENLDLYCFTKLVTWLSTSPRPTPFDKEY